MIGTVSSAFLAVHRTDKLLAVLSGLLMFEIAAENAAAKEWVKGPGTFVPALLDELYALRNQALSDEGTNPYLSAAKVRLVPV